MSKYESVKLFLLGAITVLLLVHVLLDNSVFASNCGYETGRYQMKVNSQGVTVIIDSKTGAVRFIIPDFTNDWIETVKP